MTSPWKIDEIAVQKRDQALAANKFKEEDALAIDLHSYISTLEPEFDVAVAAVAKLLASYISIFPPENQDKTLEVVVAGIVSYLKRMNEARKK